MKRRQNLILMLVATIFLLVNCGNNTTSAGNDITTDPTVNNTVKTDGTLSVSTSTSTAGGNYSPRNIVAIWIESESGTYVKTLLAYAAARKQYLTHWASNSGYNTTDATTGATKSSYGTYTVSWNGTDKSGNLVGDGTYKVCMELTDKAGTGNYHEFTFTKGTTSATVSPSNVSSFSNIAIVWTPK